ncbi:hypothetical protein A0H81_10992 [Grifola frondosa]|uniref:Uncharacterized protein n=1 Tax=Grifola frondosa TaxID=5627 RepID=A0A1C7M127_GRIFR|nr:hypothetical protein A0H81_10992 [Grifola frondosa]
MFMSHASNVEAARSVATVQDQRATIAASALAHPRLPAWPTSLGLWVIRAQLPDVLVGLHQAASRRIVMDLCKLFPSVPYWFNFINIPLPWRAAGPEHSKRTSAELDSERTSSGDVHPEFGIGAGPPRDGTGALALQKRAQSALEASLNAGWINCGLVQASLPSSALERGADPVAVGDTRRVSAQPRAHYFGCRRYPTSGACKLQPNSPQGFSCSSYTLAHACPEAVEYASLMCGMPAWTDVSEGEICKEEYRRLAWSSLLFAASHSSYDTSDSAFSPQMDLFIMDSTNVMFPAEHLEWKHGLPTPLSKNSIWTLCMCILLLWHSCMCVRLDPSLSKAQFAFTSWLEMNAVGDAMDRHTCVDELNFIQGHEILFDSRMHISFELQQFIQPAYA